MRKQPYNISGVSQKIKHRDKKYFVGHRAHSSLPGPLHEGNALADALTKVIVLNLSKKIEIGRASCRERVLCVV